MVKITSDLFPLMGFIESRQGGRAENQDDAGYAETPQGFLLVVCDGMGGGPGGKTASLIAKTEIIRTLQQMPPQVPAQEAFKRAAQAADLALKNRMHAEPRLAGMGSTFVAILLRKSSAIIAHAGDSRCYRLHRGRMVFRTRDHSLVGELVSKRALTEEQARTSPQSNLITRGLGSVSNSQPEVDEVPYSPGDRFVLCTDGVWGMMEQRQLLKRFKSLVKLNEDMPRMADEIDRLGFSQGGHHDNHTFAVIDVRATSTLRDPLSVRLLQPRWLVPLSVVLLMLLAGGCIVAWQCSSAPTIIRGAGVGAGSELPSSGGNSPSRLFTPEDALPSSSADSFGNASTSADTSRTAHGDDSPPETTSSASRLPHSHEVQMLEEIRRNVRNLRDLKCEKQDEAVKRSDQLAEDICSRLRDLRNTCDSLKERSTLRRGSVEQVYLYAERYKGYLKKVRPTDGHFVIIDRGRRVVEHLQQELDRLVETHKNHPTH